MTVDLKKLDVKHQLMGNAWSYNDLKAFERVKVYSNTSHDTTLLVKSPDGKLLLYTFHEEMGFPNDYYEEYFFLVESVELADEYHEKNLLTLRSVFPEWIHITPNWDIHGTNQRDHLALAGWNSADANNNQTTSILQGFYPIPVEMPDGTKDVYRSLDIVADLDEDSNIVNVTYHPYVINHGLVEAEIPLWLEESIQEIVKNQPYKK